MQYCIFHICQLRKLGLLYPEDSLPDSIRQLFQQMWANNGDTISRQYAGTVALKGDYTRTGERTINGLMKDGVNSANRCASKQIVQLSFLPTAFKFNIDVISFQ